MVMREVLKEEFTIDEADNGDDGIAKGLNNSADIIILDYHLPKKDGLEVISAIRNKNPNVPVIVLTGYLNPESEAQFNRLGASKIFPKPFNYRTLIEAIKHLVIETADTPSQAAEGALQQAFSHSPVASPKTEILKNSMNTLSALAEKVEYLQSITEKYWIEPNDISMIRETARRMDAELRQFYGKANSAIFDTADFAPAYIAGYNKPCLSGEN